MSSAYHPLTSFESLTQPIELERLGSSTRFRPWKRPVTRLSGTNQFNNFPSIGFFALVGSLLTVFLSLGILLGINGRETWPSNGIFNILQPASVLSLHMSLNALLVEIALVEGLNIAWWYQATKPDTTLRDLHNIWAVGHSYRRAIQVWHGLDWLTLAAIFVAVAPINGVLLQAAITTPVQPVMTNHTLTVPMVKQLDLGYSAYPAPTATSWGAYTLSQWISVWKQVTMSQWTGFADYAYFGSVSNKNGSEYDFGYNNMAPYAARVIGAGFDMTCNASTEPYDLEQGNKEEVYGRIFNSYTDWDYTIPNEITVSFLWKASAPCTGSYQVRNCVLRAASVEYPIEISMNVSGSPYKGPFFSLAAGSTRANDRTIAMLPVYPQEGVENTTFGGIAGSLLDFNSYYDITTYANGTYTFADDGPLVKAIEPTFSGYAGNPQCSLSFQYSLNQLASYLTLGKQGPIDKAVQQGDVVTDADIDPSELLFERLRQAMFLASMNQGSRPISTCCAIDDGIPHDDDYFFQSVTASQTLQVAKYHVRWWLWGVSVALTWITCLLVVPLFYGYWLLNRRTSMSPVEIARLFHAPVISDYDEKMDHKAVLRRAGDMKVYDDIRASTSKAPSMRAPSIREEAPEQEPLDMTANIKHPERSSVNEYGYQSPFSVSPSMDFGSWMRSPSGHNARPSYG